MDTYSNDSERNVKIKVEANTQIMGQDKNRDFSPNPDNSLTYRDGHEIDSKIKIEGDGLTHVKQEIVWEFSAYPATMIEDISSDDCDLETKTEIKEEPYRLDFLPNPVAMVLDNSLIYRDGHEIDSKIKIEGDGLTHVKQEIVREFSAYPATMIEDISSDDCELETKIEIKEEPYRLEEISSEIEERHKTSSFTRVIMNNENEDETNKDCQLLESSRLNTEEVFSDNVTSTLFINENLEKKKCTETRNGSTGIEKPTPSDLHENEVVNVSSKQQNSTNVDKRPYKCSICNESFTEISNLKRHVLHHEDKYPFMCEICEKNFTQMSKLKRHHLIHECKKPYSCKLCEKRFAKISNLKRHLIHHEVKKPIKCNICDKSFSQMFYLQIHILRHQGDKPYQCEVCNKSFSRISTLKIHSLLHQEKKPYKCNICEQSFIQIWRLKRHSIIHEVNMQHRCQICKKSFNRMENLKRHILQHDGKKPIKCNICEKIFANMSKLKEHIMHHERKRPIQPDIYDKDVVQMSPLQTHMRSVFAKLALGKK